MQPHTYVRILLRLRPLARTRGCCCSCSNVTGWPQGKSICQHQNALKTAHCDKISEKILLTIFFNAVGTGQVSICGTDFFFFYIVYYHKIEYKNNRDIFINLPHSDMQ